MRKSKKEDVYDYFLAKEGSPIKAMGMCYFAYAWGLLFLGFEIAPFKFKKTPLGPVDTTLLESEGKRSRLNKDIVTFLHFVWTKYEHYSSEEIMGRAMKQPPYEEADVFISKESIKRFYKKVKKAAK